MLRLVVLGLVLACAVSLSSSAVILENGMPIHWAQTASQVTELPMQDGILYPDPWNYLHRMSLYRLMIAATDPFMGSMGTNATDSPLWGLTLQLGWILTSGVQDYCTTYASCKDSYPDAMSAWDAFFQVFVVHISSVSDDVKKDSILGLYWAGQMASTYASAACNARYLHYSSVEVSFANSWLNSAEFVSAARFQSNLAKSVLFLSPLPSRILLVHTFKPHASAWYDTCSHKPTKYYCGSLVNLWKRAMCSVNTRQKGAELLEQLLLNPSFATSTFLSIITEMTTSC
uniref:Phospholipase B-like n=1 Tax=Amphilophus citrinellus TaxID=61819 RepID=A0A3Q0QVS5_AMPCI